MGRGETGAGEYAESAVAGAKHVLPERGVLAPGSGELDPGPTATPDSTQSFLQHAAFEAVLVRRVGHDLLGGLIDRPEAAPGSGRHRSMKEIPYGTYFQRWSDDCEAHQQSRQESIHGRHEADSAWERRELLFVTRR
jgi:hypothetical protein